MEEYEQRLMEAINATDDITPMDVHMNRIGNKMVALEPHILKQDELLSRIYGVLRPMYEWLSSEDVSECFILNPVCDKRGQYCGAIENLSAEIKGIIL